MGSLSDTNSQYMLLSCKSQSIILLYQAESTKGKNVIIGEKRSKLLKRGNIVLEKKTPEVSLKNSALREQDQKRSTRSTKTCLESGSYGNFVKKSQKQEEGVAELWRAPPSIRRKEPLKSRKCGQVKLTKPSLGHREQPDSRPHQGNYAATPYSFDGLVAP